MSKVKENSNPTHHNFIHGGTGTKEYRTWKHIKGRCFTKSDYKYPDYGGRGITMCDRWRYFFVKFLDDVGYAPDDSYSLDRIDNNGNYEPGNVRWASASQQANNQRRTLFIEFDGLKYPCSQFAKIIGMTPMMFKGRIKAKWPLDAAILTPKSKHYKFYTKMTKEEKIKHLETEIKKATEEGNEEYLKYILRIREMTINVHDGGTVIFQSGKPNPPYS